MSNMRSAPLAIGGCPRSGTTALVQLFNSNPSVRISSEENLLNSAQVLGKLLGTRERRTKVYNEKGTRALSSRETLSADILRSNFSSVAVWPTIRHLYQLHHSQESGHSPLILWGDKFPNYFKDIDKVLSIEDVRYLHITRNPFDVVNSMLRRTEMAKQGKDWWRAITDIDAMIKTWEEAYKTIGRVEGNTNVHHINYEDLIFDFEHSISKVNSFLDVDLTYQNILVTDPKKHYERSFLNQEIIELMLDSPEITAYIEKHAGNLKTKFVSTSLKGIEQKRHKTTKESVGPVKVFIAATASEWLPARVLEFSIREQTNCQVEIQFLYQSEIDIPVPNDLKNRARTPFSFQRFLIPELCAHSGRAIYLDSDMLVFTDIAELWNQPFSGCDLQTVQEVGKDRPGQFSVMLLNCDRLNWDIKKIVSELDTGNLDYAGLMFEMKIASKIGRDIDPEWNSLETFNSESTKLFHYTDMNTQPWISLANPNEHLWIACLQRAISSGFVLKEEVKREIEAGYVRPSLLAQLDTQVGDTLSLPRKIRKLDSGFLAPYKQFHSCRASFPVALFHLLRRFYYKARSYC